MTCQIGDDFEEGAEYLSIEGEPEDSQNSTISDNGVGNQYYSKTKISLSADIKATFIHQKIGL